MTGEKRLKKGLPAPAPPPHTHPGKLTHYIYYFYLIPELEVKKNTTISVVVDTKTIE